MTTEIQSPNPYVPGHKPSIFLGGSIELDTAERWQSRLIAELSSWEADVVFLNPRRDDWDNTVGQTASDPRFAEQVNWELDRLEQADIILFYFDPNTKSPITLMELGLYAKTGRAIVCCPDGFWRKGNVEIVCQRNSIPLTNTYEQMLSQLAFTLGFYSRMSVR